MAGIFGDSDYDKAFERDLDDYLNGTFNYTCDECGEEFDEQNFCELTGSSQCPNCGSENITNNYEDYDDPDYENNCINDC